MNEFIPPRPCPIFEPSDEEFKDPLTYIAKIKPIAEKFGICKIKPPLNWQPPFAVNIDKVRFTPRLQRLNELEATTRIKLNFLDQIARFWDLQGFKLRIPQVDRKPLDLYSFYRAVKNEGGYNIVVRDRKWAKISVYLGYSPHNKSVGGILRQHYEKILLPFHLFKSGESLDIIKNREKYGDFYDNNEKDENYTPHAIPYRQSIKLPLENKESYTRRTKRFQSNQSDTPTTIDLSTNNELKKLQFYGAGPKLPGVPHYIKDETKSDDCSIFSIKSPTPTSSFMASNSPNSCGTDEDVITSYSSLEGVSIIQKKTSSPELSSAGDNDNLFLTKLLNVSSSFSSKIVYPSTMTSSLCSTAITAAPAFKTNPENSQFTGLFRLRPPSPSLSTIDSSPSTIVPSLLNKGEKVENLFTQLSSRVFSSTTANDSNNNNTNLKETAVRSALLGGSISSSLKLGNSPLTTLSGSAVMKEFSTNSNLSSSVAASAAAAAVLVFPNKKVATIKPNATTTTSINFLNIENVCCHTCGSGDDESRLLLCESCDLSFHTFCLVPPLKEVPKGDWRCPLCIANVCKNLIAPFGFEQSCKEYTLHSFGEMADEFKATYFNMPFHMVPTQTVEKEFWRLVSSIVEDITVCYGADLHCIEHGSGFPTESFKDKFSGEEDYIYSPWNLNNLPVLNKSILKYISGDISGMKVPWMYVGMCFSTFCWHTEDHWSYSINYLHWGEPKTWYGVPGSGATLLESVMKAQVPELFESQKDLLHHLVTLMNPNILMANGVPVCRCDQYPGEFMVTFPRAYHAGFNQGYNLAEAVNFCPSDWIPIGRNCVSHYRDLKRFCVFSHDELICKMATCPEHLDLSVANATLTDMAYMIEEERKLRKLLYQKGVTKADREIYELLSDDERKCDWCNTTCFLSALTCNCVPNKIVCLYDIDHLCKSCKPIDLCLKYRYTLDELPSMYNQLKTHVEFFQNWCKRVKECLEGRGKKEGTREDKIITTTTSKAQHLYDDDIKCEISISNGDVEDEDVPKISSLEDLKILYKESLYKKFPPSDLTNLLISQIEKAEKYGERTREILKKIYLKNKVPRKQRLNVHNYKDFGMIRFEDLRKLVSEIKALPCSLKEETEMEELLAKSIELIEKMYSALTDKIPDVSKLQELVESKLLNLLYIPERDRLQNAYEVGIWLAEVRGKLSQPELVTIEDIQKLMNRGESIKIDDDTTNHPALNKCLLEMAEIVAAAKAWEDKAQNLLSNKPTLACLEAFMSEMGPVPLHLPNVNEIKDYIGKANEALIQMNAILKGETILSIHEMGSLLESYQSFPLKFENPEFVQFETWTRSCTSWKERAIRCFLKKNSIYTLDEVICPRSYSSQLISPALLPPLLPSCKEKAPPNSKKRNKNFNNSKEILPSNTKIVGTLFEELVSEIKRLSNTTTAQNDNQLISSKDVDNQLVMNMYGNFKSKELEHVEEVRALNNEKYQMYSLLLTRRQSLSIHLDNSADNTNTEEGDEEKFCKCAAGKFIPPMLCCQICREWFHHDCILPSKFVQTLHNLVAKTKKIALPHVITSSSPQKTITEYDNEEITLINPPIEEETAVSNTNIPYVNLDAKFLCPECLRSRRPKLETAFSLLISLQKLPVKVVESYALQALTERAVKWQENVQKFLTEPEVVLFLMACKERKTVKRLQKCTSSFLANSVVDKTSRIDIVEPCKTTILGSAPLQYKTPSETISSLDFSSSVSVPSTSLNNLGLNMNTANSAIASAGPVALKSVRIGSINLNNNTQQLINNQQQNYNNNNNNLFNSIISPTSISIQPNTVLSLDSTPPTNTVEKDCFKDDSSFLKISLPTTLATLSIQKLTNLMAAGAHSSSGTPQLFLRSAAPPQTLKFYRKTVTTGGGGEDENDPKFNFTARKNEQLDLGCDFGLQNLSDDNLVCLKDSRVRELERLMLEGDLIELTLHETQHLWEIYKEALLYLRRENIRKGDNPFKTHQEFVELGDVASVYSYMCSGKCNDDESEQCGTFNEYDRYVNQSPLHKDINQLASGPARQYGGKRKQNLSSKAVMKRNINSPNNSCDYYDGGVEEDLKKDESGIMAASSNMIDKQSHLKKTRKTIPKDLPTPATNDDHSYESKILSTQTNTMQGSKSKYPDTLEELGLIATPSIETTEEFVRNKETKPKNSNNIAPLSKTTKLLSQLKRTNHQQLTQKLKNKKAKMFRKSRKVPNRVRVNFPDKTNLRATYLAKADQGQVDKIAIVDDVEKQIIDTDTPNYLVGNHGKPAKVRVRRKPLKYLNTFSERSSNSSRARTSAKKDGKMNISAKRAKMSGDRHEETDENSKCSLPDCLEPTGSDITWVQCDGGCDQWFHVTCVGLNQFQINDNDDYYCYKCKETCDFNENQFTKISEFKQNEKSMD